MKNLFICFAYYFSVCVCVWVSVWMSGGSPGRWSQLRQLVISCRCCGRRH